MAQTFPQFLKLPQEMQGMVWECSTELASLQPRVVEVRFAKHWNVSIKHDFVADIPPLLYACHNWRVYVLKGPQISAGSFYSVSQYLESDGIQLIKLLFGCEYAAHPMYFNPEIDSLFLREYTYRSTVCQMNRFLRELPNKDQIQRIMLPWLSFWPWKIKLIEFPNLKWLTFIKTVHKGPQALKLYT